MLNASFLTFMLVLHLCVTIATHENVQETQLGRVSGIRYGMVLLGNRRRLSHWQWYNSEEFCVSLSFLSLPLSLVISLYYTQDSPLFINRQSCPVQLGGNVSPPGAVVLSAANSLLWQRNALHEHVLVLVSWVPADIKWLLHRWMSAFRNVCNQSSGIWLLAWLNLKRST